MKWLSLAAVFVIVASLVAPGQAADELTAREARLVAILTDPALFDLRAEDFATTFGFQGTIVTTEKTDRDWTFDISVGEGTGGEAFFLKDRPPAPGYRLSRIHLFFSMDDAISATRLVAALQAKFGPAFVLAAPGSNTSFTWRRSTLRLIRVVADVPGVEHPLVYSIEIQRGD